MSRILPILLSASLLACAAATVHASDGDEYLAFRMERGPSVIRAVDMVEEGPTKIVKAGDDVVVVTSHTAKSHLTQGFRVRIFTLSGPDGDPKPVIEHDDCLVFFTSVWNFDAPREARLPLFPQTSAGWLTVGSDGKVQDGHYLLVFEISGPQERILRLHKDDVVDYFRNGLRLRIEKSNVVGVEAVRQALAVREGVRLEHARDFRANTNTTPCYRYPPNKVRVERESVPELALLMQCDSAGQAIPGSEMPRG